MNDPNSTTTSAHLSHHEEVELAILNQISTGSAINQRMLSKRLGVALGLVNSFIKRLAKKGFIKMTTIPGHRVLYALTPKGVMEKARKVFHYIRYSYQYYTEARRMIRERCYEALRLNCHRFVIYGVTELAELVFLTLRELGLEPVAIVDDRLIKAHFLGIRVTRLIDISKIGSYDIVIVTRPETSHEELTRLFPRKRIIILVRAEKGVQK